MTRRPLAKRTSIPLTRRQWPLWSGLTFVAIAGSLVYGASLGLAVPQWHPAQAAVRLAGSAGLAWCVFGPVLMRVTRLRPFTCVHACLITMACGEAVLVLGAIFNVVGRSLQFPAPVPANAAIVAVSNVVMAAVLAGQLRSVGVPVRQTLSLWLLVLDGAGAVFFWLFHLILPGGP